MRYIFIIIVAFGLISFNYRKSFSEGDAEALGIEIDSHAVSVLLGTITHVRDGDTFEVKGTPVRISAVDCPENSINAGKRDTRYAKQCRGKQDVCELAGAKTYDRVVGYWSIEGKEFAQLMKSLNEAFQQ